MFISKAKLTCSNWGSNIRNKDWWTDSPGNVSSGKVMLEGSGTGTDRTNLLSSFTGQKLCYDASLHLLWVYLFIDPHFRCCFGSDLIIVPPDSPVSGWVRWVAVMTTCSAASSGHWRNCIFLDSVFKSRGCLMVCSDSGWQVEPLSLKSICWSVSSPWIKSN